MMQLFLLNYTSLVYVKLPCGRPSVKFIRETTFYFEHPVKIQWSLNINFILLFITAEFSVVHMRQDSAS